MESEFQLMRISSIVANPLNPRKDIGDLSELKQSIIAQGLIQPMVVRPNSVNGNFELIAGERRYTAIKEAIEEKKIDESTLFPVIVKDYTDDEALQAMFVENLLRKDLTEHEQAESFHKYLQKYPDPNAVVQLAESTGLSAHYIQKRAKIMTLPEGIVALWKEDKLLYGHLEQLLRINPEDAIVMAREIVENKMSVSAVRNEIIKNKADLGTALFDKEKEGCMKCQCNSSIQQGLFGPDFKTDKITCLDPKCFFEKQRKLISDNWQRLSEVKKNKTNGVVFVKHSPDKVIFLETKEKCFTCPNYVTFISEYAEMLRDKGCNGAEECFKETYPPAPTPAKTASVAKKSTKVKEQKTQEETIAKKDENCGKEFADRFFLDNLPAKMEAVPPNHPENLKVMLIALIKSNSKGVAEALNLKATEYVAIENGTRELLTSALTMGPDECLRWLAKISGKIVMSSYSFDLSTRKTIAGLFDLQLDRDFVMTEDYLKKKTKDQLIKLSTAHKILKANTEKELSQFKKTAIISLILAQDLKGIIPDDIMDVANGKYDEKEEASTEEKEPTEEKDSPEVPF